MLQDIITQYISTIKALHVLDPSGTTLAAVASPVQLYLSGSVRVAWACVCCDVLCA